MSVPTVLEKILARKVEEVAARSARSAWPSWSAWPRSPTPHVALPMR